MQTGKFITIDGIEGAGKSTQIKFICQYLKDRGIRVILTREPGGIKLGEKIRTLLLSPQTQSIHPETELLLIFAARYEHVQAKIIPALKLGNWVLSDRFTDASYAYQGGGRGMPIKRIAELEKWALQGFAPDMTLLLDVDVKLGMARIESREKKDRIEQEDIDFFNRVRAAYIDRARQSPQRIKLIDSSKTPAHTSRQIQAVLDGL